MSSSGICIRKGRGKPYYLLIDLTVIPLRKSLIIIYNFTHDILWSVALRYVFDYCISKWAEVPTLSRSFPSVVAVET